VIVIRSNRRSVLPTWVKIPIGWSVAVKSTTWTLSDRFSRRPPVPSPVVTTPVILGASCPTTDRP
jgi:hypothetical protein